MTGFSHKTANSLANTTRENIIMETKVIVITGASGGIGAALAKMLAKQGHHLVLAARRKDLLEQTAKECGNGAVAVVTDVTRLSDIEHLRDVALEKFDHVDVWINNAGRGISRTVMELTEEDLDEILAVNLKSAFYGIKTIMPHFQSRGKGHLINVSSFLSRVPFVTFRSAYNAAKAALNALTANLRVDMAREYPGIHVSLVMPGAVANEFSKHALYSKPINLSGSGMKAQTTEEAAGAILDLIEHPVAEIYTNPALAETVHRYYNDVGAFEQEFMLKRP